MAKRKIKKGTIENAILYTVLGLIALVPIVTIIIMISTGSTKISDSEWEYMYSYIEESFGAGEEFHIISEKVSSITKEENIYHSDYPVTRSKYLGKRISIIGYFDSQDEIYSVSFVKYNNDYGIYKGGELTFTAVVTNRNKDEYIK